MTDTIISLTSIPPRIERIGSVVESLLRQTARIDAVILWVPRTYRRPEYKDYTVPKLPSGIEVRYCDFDYGPATKILPAARSFGGEDVRIIYCDDDEIYEPGWAETLIRSGDEYPDDCVAINGLLVAATDHADFVRSWRFRALNIVTLEFYRLYYRSRNENARPGIGPVDIAQGFGGVMVRPHFFGPEAYEIPDILWTVDDIWLSGHMASRGVTIRRVANRRMCEKAEAAFVDDLTSYAYKGNDRIAAEFACVEWGAVRIIETPGWGKLNLNRSVAYDE